MHLKQADEDGDIGLDRQEFLNFIRNFGMDVKCYSGTQLSIQQGVLFNTMACRCLQEPGFSPFCCLRPAITRVAVKGANLNENELTFAQRQDLLSICTDVANTMDSTCPPTAAPTEPLGSGDAIGVPTIAPTSDWMECMPDLIYADADQDGFLDINEYGLFLSAYGGCGENIDVLDDRQQFIFYGLACPCLLEPSDQTECCLPGTATISIIGLDTAEPESPDAETLRSICRQSYTVLPEDCSQIDEPSVPNPPAGGSSGDFDLELCITSLDGADTNRDSALTQNEFLFFLQDYGSVVTCYSADDLTLRQRSLFLRLACRCLNDPGFNPLCCRPQIATIRIPGAAVEDGQRTHVQRQDLLDICKDALETMTARSSCPPTRSPALPVEPSTLAPTPDMEESCLPLLISADVNADWSLNLDEYTFFISLFSGCTNLRSLTEEQQYLFYRFACPCLDQPSDQQDCCLPGTASVSVEGADKPFQDQSLEQSILLQSICSQSYTQMDLSCGTQIENEFQTNGADQESNYLDDCVGHLLTADSNKDLYLNRQEYAVFVDQAAKAMKCYYGATSTLQENLVFSRIACRCLSLPEFNPFCCILGNAKIDIRGAELSSSARSAGQRDELTYVCDTSLFRFETTCAPSSNVPDPPTGTEGVQTYDQCSQDLTEADLNRDGMLELHEYFYLVMVMGMCLDRTEPLSSGEESAFNSLAVCECPESNAVMTKDCCPTGNTSRSARMMVSIDGAWQPNESRTVDQQSHLETVCGLTLFFMNRSACTPDQSSEQGIVSPPATNPESAPTLSPEDFENCVSDIVASDVNRDGFLDLDEFIVFVSIVNSCPSIRTLTTTQQEGFYSLACPCLKDPNESLACCMAEMAMVSIVGAMQTTSTGSPSANETLGSICRLASLETAQYCENDNEPLGTPAEGFNLQTCTDSLRVADRDGDSQLSRDEFLVFIREYGQETMCYETSELTFQQIRLFNTLACRCRREEGFNPLCCRTTRARVKVGGIEADDAALTQDQRQSLASICRDATETMSFNCAVGGVDATPPPLVQFDFPECLQQMSDSDQNQDEYLDVNEYLLFVEKRKCDSVASLGLTERAAFNTLACSCLSEVGASLNCCLPGIAKVNILGADAVSRTNRRTQQLRTICIATDAAIINSRCSDPNGPFTPPPYPTPVALPDPADTPLWNVQLGVCTRAMVLADDNMDGSLDLEEFRFFVNEYGKSMCSPPSTQLSLLQRGAFNTLACLCLSNRNLPLGCCLPSQAEVAISGAAKDDSSRTSRERLGLTGICGAVAATIETDCPDNGKFPTNSPLVSVNLEACTSHLRDADENGDDGLDLEEYRNFLTSYGKEEKCIRNDLQRLSALQSVTFTSLACACLLEANSQWNCCLPNQAKVSIKGAELDASGVATARRTDDQTRALRNVCVASDALIRSRCGSGDNETNSDDGVFQLPPLIEDLLPPSIDLDIEKCARDMVEADLNKDEKLDRNEYLIFIQKWGECPYWEDLSAQERSAFATLACGCLINREDPLNCCLPRNAFIRIEGASRDRSEWTVTQRVSLRAVCSTTNMAIRAFDCEEPADSDVTGSSGGRGGENPPSTATVPENSGETPAPTPNNAGAGNADRSDTNSVQDDADTESSSVARVQSLVCFAALVLVFVEIM